MKLFIFSGFLFFSLFAPVITQAATPPDYFIVRGKLVGADLVPKSGSYNIRASLWGGADALDGDPTDISSALWSDVFTTTLESDGRFEVLVGSDTALPNPFDFTTYNYIQLDAKAAADSTYNILDPLGNNNSIDRQNLLTLPFKSNIEEMFGKTFGFTAGDVPYLDGSAQLPDSAMPTSVTSDISANASGILTNLTSINSNTSNINTNTTNISSNTAALGDSTKTFVLAPEYPGSSLQPDGADNVGSFDSGYDSVDYHNFYEWTTTQGTLQDYDIYVRAELPRDFVSWDANPLTFDYKTTDGVTTNNKIDITFLDTANTAASLTSNTGLASATWATYSSADDLSGGTWTPGGLITLKIKMYALSAKAAYAGELILKYTGSNK